MVYYTNNKLFHIFLGENTKNGQLYRKINEKIENLIWIGGLISFGICMPMLVIPEVILSYYAYYALDFGESSYILAFPAS